MNAFNELSQSKYDELSIHLLARNIKTAEFQIASNGGSDNFSLYINPALDNPALVSHFEGGLLNPENAEGSYERLWDYSTKLALYENDAQKALDDYNKNHP